MKPSMLVLAIVAGALSSSIGTAQEASNSKAKQDAASTNKPEVRFVQVEQAMVYAGPNKEVYPTGIVKAGDSVEVYDRTDDGWLAIRPPRGSFSWIPAAQGFLLPGGRACEVTDPSAVSWIGTGLGTAKQYRWQVRLNRGEQLIVLGEQSIHNPQTEKPALWYKIAPPNGEYRWIEEQATSREPVAIRSQSEQLAEATEASESDPQVITAQGTQEDNPASTSILLAGAQSPSPQPQSANAASKKSAKRPGNQPPTGSTKDPFETWHAMEFKNGSFRFPGVARMFGYEPKPAGPPSKYDPFDLTQHAPNRGVPGNPAYEQSQVSESAQVEPSNDALAMRRDGGWRDPRDLRRTREGQVYSESDSSLANSSLQNALALDSSQPVGTGVDTGVIPASAIGPARSQRADETDGQWYGVQQAPANVSGNYQPINVSHSDLSDIQLMLSEMVAGPEHTWNLMPLADRTRYFIEHGSTAIERGEARLLLDRIESFANLAKRSAELGVSGSPVVPAAYESSATGNSSNSTVAWASSVGLLPSAGSSATSANAPRFDATGWIVPVHSSGREMPTHALTNDSGKIIVYLTPAPGINLARYQGQAVGVYGLRGYLPQLKSNHIQVQRAVRLQ